MTVFDYILKITRQLYPKGRAFKMPFNSWFERLHHVWTAGQERYYNATTNILDAMLPDNERYSESDAAAHERIYGLITNPAVPLSQRKSAILQKMAYPGINPAHGHYLNIQNKLQAAGFDVWVHENMFPDYPNGFESKAPVEVYPLQTQVLTDAQHGVYQGGEVMHGLNYNNMCAKSIYQNEDNHFRVGNSWNCTFFIGGQTLGTLADVPAVRELEFRQLILTLKQTQLIAFLYINYN